MSMKVPPCLTQCKPVCKLALFLAWSPSPQLWASKREPTRSILVWVGFCRKTSPMGTCPLPQRANAELFLMRLFVLCQNYTTTPACTSATSHDISWRPPLAPQLLVSFPQLSRRVPAGAVTLRAHPRFRLAGCLHCADTARAILPGRYADLAFERYDMDSPKCGCHSSLRSSE